MLKQYVEINFHGPGVHDADLSYIRFYELNFRGAIQIRETC